MLLINANSIFRISAASLTLMPALNAFAQTAGSLTYLPAAVDSVAQPVPIPPLLLLPLGIAVALLGGRFLRRQDGRTLLGALLLTAGAGLGALSSVHIPKAIAALMVELNQPEGGTVEVPLAAAVYTNTSGIPLRITGLTPPACTSRLPADECVTGLSLADGESCNTAFSCPQTITLTSIVPVGVKVGDVYTAVAEATSGLPVTFASVTPAVCTIAGGTVDFIAAGECQINIQQAGDAIYEPATLVQLVVTVTQPLPAVTVVYKSDGLEAANPAAGAFTLARSGVTTDPLTVNFTLGGTATGVDSTPSADLTDDEDYQVDSLAAFTIPAGAASVDIPITVLDDQVYDPDETVILTLIADNTYTLGNDSQATLAIKTQDKRIFVSAQAALHTGDLGGVAGADAKCNADGFHPGDGSMFKAMLAGGGRSATPQSDWVLKADYRYFRVYDYGYVGRANANAQFTFPANMHIGSELGTRVWTGLKNDWTSSTLNCQNWTSSGASPVTGTAGAAFKSHSGMIDQVTEPCSKSWALYCVEQ